MGSLVSVSKVEVLVFNGVDKISHLAAYCALSFTLFFALEKQILSKLNVVIIIFGLSFYGFFIEILQKYMTESRIFDILDIVANTAGVLLGYLFFLALKIKSYE